MKEPVITLPSGRKLNLNRPRSEGILDAEEFEYCRKNNIPLQYDPVQIGWCTMSAPDDLSDALRQFVSPPVRDHAQNPDQVIERLRKQLRRDLGPVLSELSTGTLSLVDARSVMTEIANKIEVGSHCSDPMILDRCHCLLHNDVVKAQAPFEAIPPPTVASRFSYRQWELADLETYSKIVGNPNVWKYLPDDLPSPFNEAVATDLIELSRTGSHHEVCAVACDGQIIGQARLLFNDSYPGIRAAEVAYLLGEEFWGKGLGSALVQDHTQRSFLEQHLEFIDAWIRPDNAGSIRSVERAGYRRDVFRGENEFAGKIGRLGFHRYKCYRTQVFESSPTSAPSLGKQGPTH